MMYFNGDSNTDPIYEGIDKIKLTLPPHLFSYLDFSRSYNRKPKLNSNKKIIFNHNEKWFHTGNKHLNLFVKYTKYRYFIYFIIHGEYIDLTQNIKDVIIEALYEIITNGLIEVNQYLWGKDEKSNSFMKMPQHKLTIERSFIRNNLFLFVQNMKELELYFDMDNKSIRVGENEYVFNKKSSSFHTDLNDFQKSSEYRKVNAIIKMEETIYSKDYHYSRRLSTFKIYNRSGKLREENNVYKQKIINNYLCDTRLEILLTNVNTCNRLNLNNIDGNYNNIMFKYKPLLEVFFAKFVPHIHFENIHHLKYLPRMYENARLNPHRKYTEDNLMKLILKYPDRNKLLFNISYFRTILDNEYKRLKDEYFFMMKQYLQFMNKDIRMDVNSSSYYSPYDKYFDDSLLSIGDEYMPIKLYNPDN